MGALMPRIKLKQFVRECPHNAAIIRDNGESRKLIRDFSVSIDGEHRLTLSRHYSGKGYYIYDPEHRPIKVNWRNVAQIKSQSDILRAICILLEVDLVPTLTDIALDNLRDEAFRANARFDKSIESINHSKTERLDDLYSLTLAVATADTPVLEQKLVDRARTLIAEIADQAIAWDKQDEDNA